MSKASLLYLAALLLFVVDRAFKVRALSGSKQLYNYGSIFSLPVPRHSLFIVIVGCLVALSYLLWQQSRKGKSNVVSQVSLFLIFLGGLSNFWDRVQYSAVLDYWHVGSFMFNLADIGIFIGVILLTQQLLHRSS